jgi:D-glycero-alpha-D-manno-heptose-7-phosphate kinase
MELVSIQQQLSLTGKVRARAPLRLGFAGGGTDVSPYSDEFGGYVLNATIDKYAYATLIPRKKGLRFHAADIGVVWEGEASEGVPLQRGVELHIGVYNRVVRDYLGGKPVPLELITHSEAPPGSGLGSSSTMVVALLQAFVEFFALPLGEYEIAQLAYSIEREDLGFAGGKQDQYAATFGGFNFMEFYHDRVIVNPLRVNPANIAELESSLVLFYTGVSRESANIIKEQTQHVVQRDASRIQALHDVKAQSVRMKEAVLRADWEKFATSLRSGWEAKKRMASSISNTTIDQVYDAAIAAGALGGKVSGAGGGGFMMFIVDPTRRPEVIRALEKFTGQTMTATFVEHGAHAWRVA